MQIFHGIKTTLILLVCTVTLVGCTRHEPVPPPKTKRNVHSAEKIELILTVEQSGHVDKVEARSAYVIINESDCVPIDYSNALGGLRNQSIEYIELPVISNGGTRFRVEALKAPFLDENYYALGVCKWALSSVHFTMRRSGVPQTVVATNTDIENNRNISALCLRSPSPSGTLCANPNSVGPAIRILYFPVKIESHKD